MIEYKAKEIGVAVVLTEESYTSGTSFVDNEMPVKEFYNKSRRIERGLFKNSDLYRKQFQMKKFYGIEGVRFTQFVVGIA